MIFYQLCVIGLYLAFLENGVIGDYCETHPSDPRFESLEAPFYFGYTPLNSDYNMILTLKNVSRKITAVFVTAAETDGPVSKYEWVRYNYEGEQFRFCGTVTTSRITIGLELHSSHGVCATRLVSEGRNMRTLNSITEFKTFNSHHHCLNFSAYYSCAIEIDLKHDCIAYPKVHRKKSYTTPRPRQNNSTAVKPAITHTPKEIPDIPATVRYTTTRKPNLSTSVITKHASTTTKPAISYIPKNTRNVQNTSRTLNRKFVTPKPAQNSTGNTTHTSIPHDISKAGNRNTVLDTSDSQQDSQNIPVTANDTRGTSDTSNAVDFSTVAAESYQIYITITIASTIFAMVLILLAIVIRKCCCTKRNPAGSSQLLKTDLADSPFYLNMLFRKECDREIEQNEQHQYEEINAQ